MTGQDATSAEQNAEFFAREKHGKDAAELDTYRLIREAITREVAGTERLLDVGNGGVFEYDTSQVGEIVAVDLFLDQLPASHFPPNVTARKGDALALDEDDGSYEMVLEALLYHHLVGTRPSDSIDNIRRALAEADRVLRPGGRLVIAESCVPPLVLRVRAGDVPAAGGAGQDARSWEAIPRCSSSPSPGFATSSASVSRSRRPSGFRWAGG